jgi:hypothetical protein
MRLLYVFVVCISTLPACVRYYKWGKQQFPQVDKRCTLEERISPYVRSADVYDEFQTVGKFDAMWFSDDARQCYIDAVAHRFGYSQKQKEVLVTQHHDEQRYAIVFYVLLSAVSTNGRPLLAASDKKATWSVVLIKDEKEYQAQTITSLDLDPELMTFFGKRYSQYRVAYKVTFARFDGHQDILGMSGSPVRLDFRSALYQVALSW